MVLSLATAPERMHLAGAKLALRDRAGRQIDALVTNAAPISSSSTAWAPKLPASSWSPLATTPTGSAMRPRSRNYVEARHNLPAADGPLGGTGSPAAAIAQRTVRSTSCHRPNA